MKAAGRQDVPGVLQEEQGEEGVRGNGRHQLLLWPHHIGFPILPGDSAGL